MSTGNLSRPRGAVRSPSCRAFAAATHFATAVPDKFWVIPKKLSMWGNAQYGDCVTAEEAFAKAMYSIMGGRTDELFVTEQTVIAWARSHGFLNGAYLTEVMDKMAIDPIAGSDGHNYTDGRYQTVDWTNDKTVSSAIYQGPVKIGVAAGQLENVVGQSSGWIATGFRHDGNLDHCVSLCGYGSMGDLALELGVVLPSSVNPAGRGYLLFTWNTIGIIDQQSMINITGEAWLRVPTTPEAPIPTPGPNPPDPVPNPPDPTPTPPPTPVPSTVGTWDAAAKLVSLPQGWSAAHSWFGTNVTVNPARHSVTIPRDWSVASSQSLAAFNPALIVQEIIAFFGPFISAINEAAALQIALAAFASGGPSAIVPALIANVSQWVSNPFEAMIIAYILGKLPQLPHGM